MTLRKQTMTVGIITALIALAFGAWLQYNQQHTKPMELKQATVLSAPRILNPFHLTNSHNQPFNLQQLKGHWSLIFFGFTSCPMICPTTLATLNKTYQQLEQNRQQPMPQVVFISVDPERDTPNKIKQYLASFNPHFIGATGSSEQLKKLSQEFSVVYMKTVAPHATDPKDYNIDHSSTLILVNPQGQIQAFLSAPHQVNYLTHDIRTIINTH